MKNFVDSCCVFLGCGAVIGATALLTIYGSKYWRKKRSMTSYPNRRDNRSIVGRTLTPDIFSKVKDRHTKKGYDIDKLIESGLHVKLRNNLKMTTKETLLNSTGLLVGDEECYDTFSELIDPVISEVHQIDSMNGLKSKVNLRWNEIKGGNLYGTNVISCRLSTGRNIRGYNMVPGCSSGDLLDVGRVVVKSLKSVEGEEASLIFFPVVTSPLIFSSNNSYKNKPWQSHITKIKRYWYWFSIIASENIRGIYWTRYVESLSFILSMVHWFTRFFVWLFSSSLPNSYRDRATVLRKTTKELKILIKRNVN